jgi:hypothetical protein
VAELAKSVNLSIEELAEQAADLVLSVRVAGLKEGA